MCEQERDSAITFHEFTQPPPVDLLKYAAKFCTNLSVDADDLLQMAFLQMCSFPDVANGVRKTVTDWSKITKSLISKLAPAQYRTEHKPKPQCISKKSDSGVPKESTDLQRPSEMESQPRPRQRLTISLELIHEMAQTTLTPLDDLLLRELESVIELEIDQLPTNLKRPYLLWRSGHESREIATILNITNATAATAVSHAKSRLLQALQLYRKPE